MLSHTFQISVDPRLGLPSPLPDFSITDLDTPTPLPVHPKASQIGVGLSQRCPSATRRKAQIDPCYFTFYLLSRLIILLKYLGLTKFFLTCHTERRVSSACGTSAESKYPEDVSLDHAVSRSSLEALFFSNHFCSPWIRREVISFGRTPGAAWRTMLSRDPSTRTSLRKLGACSLRKPEGY